MLMKNIKNATTNHLNKLIMHHWLDIKYKNKVSNACTCNFIRIEVEGSNMISTGVEFYYITIIVLKEKNYSKIQLLLVNQSLKSFIFLNTTTDCLYLLCVIQLE